MARVFNFSAGPSMLPLPVLEKAAEEMLDYRGSGMSVMEMSHRSKQFDAIANDTAARLRTLMQIPDNYKILLLQGGASTQFSAVPLNLIGKTGKADYIVSGVFSKKAYKEAQKYGDIRLVASGEENGFAKIPEITRSDIRDDASYVHVCFNNTIFGTKYNYIPDTGDIPLVADMSSCILSEPIDVSKFGLIYAGAQKNMAPAGLTVVIVREDLCGSARSDTPVMLDYMPQVEASSMYNTPPCYAIYIAGMVYEWLLATGGLEERKKINEKKAGLLYDYLDSQSFYQPKADKSCRSLMNVTFFTGNEDLDKKFCAGATEIGLLCLKGHRSAGGMRASIYNAMPIEGVEKLVDFMKTFAKENA